MPTEAELFRPRHRRWTAGAIVVIVVVGVIDYLVAPGITFSPFYLAPVAVTAWFGGTGMAVFASALAAVVWLWAEFASSRLDANAFVYAWNFCARLLFLLVVALLLARLHLMLRRERNMSRTDSLTALLNARAFREIANAVIARAQRYGEPLSLAFIDIDDFKRVNDTQGHGAGDRLLQCVADAIRGNVRASDVLARYGGDEFVVLLPLADETAARRAIAKVLDRTREAMRADGWPVTLSIGVVSCRPGSQPMTVDALLEEGDRLMYEAKSSGKGTIRFATRP